MLEAPEVKPKEEEKSQTKSDQSPSAPGPSPSTPGPSPSTPGVSPRPKQGLMNIRFGVTQPLYLKTLGWIKMAVQWPF
ncbi:UNVERIFIED_CONTAM: hypothetical protein FKN15_050930 [Acipenser sinensis]